MFRRPLFPPLVAWIAGILLALRLPGATAWGAVAAGVALALAAWRPSKRSLSLAALALLSCAAVFRAASVVSPSPNDLSRLLPTSESDVRIAVVGRLAGDPQGDSNQRSFPLDAEVATVSGRTIRASGRVWVKIYGGTPNADESLTYGDRARLTGELRAPSPARNPGDFDDRAYLVRQGIRSVLVVTQKKGVPSDLRLAERLDPADLSWIGLCMALKRRMEASLRSALPMRAADFLSGLLFSEQARLPESVQRDFIRTGTVHLLSTSGVHVAALAAFLTMLLGAYRRRWKKPFALCMILLLAAFGMMAGMRPAVARATFMAALVYGAELLDREPDGANLICFAALAILIGNPLDLYDPGFQYSFAAVTGLTILSPRFRPAFEKLLRAGEIPGGRSTLSEALAATFAAECALMPLVAYDSGQVSLISPIANLIVIPLSAPLIPSGLAQAAAGMISHSFGLLTGNVVSGLLWAFGELIRGLSALPGAMIDVTPPPVWLLALFYGGWVRYARPWALPSDPPPPFFSGWRKPLQRVPARSIYAFASSVLLLAPLGLLAGRKCGFPTFFGSRNGVLRFTAIDVGQGDCFLIETPDGATMLTDGGGVPDYHASKERREDSGPASEGYDVGERTVVPFLQRRGIRRLDLVVMTHPDGDHIGGLGAVLERIPTRLLLGSGDSDGSAAFRRIEAAARRNGIPYRAAMEGDRIRLGAETTLEVLNPGRRRFRGTRSDFNNNCVVLRLRFRRFTALLAGDLGEEGEKRLLPLLGPVDLLKVAHHGSRFSTSEAFVERTRPRIAVLQVGVRNRFGHPDPEVVRRLERAGARIYRTDRDGAVTVETDGESLRAKAFLRDRESALRLRPERDVAPAFSP
jgi:competence protein ComEC